MKENKTTKTQYEQNVFGFSEAQRIVLNKIQQSLGYKFKHNPKKKKKNNTTTRFDVRRKVCAVFILHSIQTLELKNRAKTPQSCVAKLKDIRICAQIKPSFEFDLCEQKPHNAEFNISNMGIDATSRFRHTS